ncbi:MAG: PH domain-containing protein [Candidatus Promineifilaceae bacterium]
MTTKMQFLGEHPIFANLLDDQLLALNQIAREYSFEPNAIIAYQRDMADSMYLVRDGRLYAKEVDEQGIVRDGNTRQYVANDFFGAEWLFEVGSHPATVTGTDEGHIIIIKGDDFRQFLRAYPDAIPRLEPIVDQDGNWYAGLSEDVWEIAEKLPLVERIDRIGPIRLLPDEIVEYYTRRSSIFLLESLLWPLLGMILIPMLAYFLIPVDSTATNILRGAVIVLPILFFGILIILRLLDWRNDYLVITNKHISHREFELRTFRTQLNKVPISMVQSVAVERPNFTANLFNIGSVRITTASNVGMIVFNGINNPSEVETVLNDLRRRVQVMDAAVAQSTMRRSVTDHFQVDSSIHLVPDEDEMFEDEDLLVVDTEPGFGISVGRLLDWRLEDGNVITYRRNYLILLWEIIPPMFLIALIIVGAVFLTSYFDIASPLFYALTLMFILFDLLWLLWRYEDWRNDIFQLTDKDVIDIDRKPFGFGESRKQAPLQNIQNVKAERPGFFATLFDYGDVHIETAGADSDIDFDRIPHPSQVLSDIFRRLEESRDAQRRKDDEKRRKDYAILLDVYRQEMEQDRIPRRTPPIDE